MFVSGRDYACSPLFSQLSSNAPSPGSVTLIHVSTRRLIVDPPSRLCPQAACSSHARDPSARVCRLTAAPRPRPPLDYLRATLERLCHVFPALQTAFRSLLPLRLRLPKQLLKNLEGMED